jgi:hypothetical protein
MIQVESTKAFEPADVQVMRAAVHNAVGSPPPPETDAVARAVLHLYSSGVSDVDKLARAANLLVSTRLFRSVGRQSAQ